MGEVQKEVNKNIRMINTSQLTSRLSCQRPIDPKRVAKIAKNWDRHQVNPLKVAIIDGVYYAIDGQHTMAAAIARNNGNDLDMPCIAEKMTEEQAAKVVAEQYKYSKKLSPLDIFRAEVEAKNPDAVYIMNVLDRHEIKLTSTAKINTISCIQTIKQINKIGPFELDRALNIVEQAWDADENRYRTEIMAAMEKFICTYHGEFEEKVLITKLSKNSAMSYIRKAKDIGLSAGVGMASIFVDVYNTNKKKGKLDKSKLHLSV